MLLKHCFKDEQQIGDTFYSEISGHQVKQTDFKVPQDFVFIFGIKY